MKVITRFAPSPTGNLHIGNIRTALYSWLFAKKNNGKFILRIEDTDVKRSKKIFIENITKTLKWLNINWDEGPYLQSQRFKKHNIFIDKMLSSGHVYKCFCTKEELANQKQEQISKKKKIRYNGKCRNLNNLVNNTKPYVIRFRIPDKGFITFIDKIRGKIIVYNNELDDFIIKRTDGTLTYNFCVVLDDLDMNITHIIRGEEHINNTPKQIHIINAIGAKIPIYAHVSMITDKFKKKISKRYHSINILEYKKNGYLPEALLNYILRLGWSYGNKEIFSLEEMKKLFNLKNLNKSPSIFNIDKLNWLNRYYLNKLPEKYMVNYLTKFCQQKNINTHNGPKIKNLYKIFSNRCNTLNEINNLCYIFYMDPIYSKNILIKQYLNLKNKIILKKLLKKFKLIHLWSVKNINLIVKEIMTELDINLKNVIMPLRIAVTGKNNTPPISSILFLMGQNKVINHLKNAISFIEFNN
ncbi:glutamate--tRNA ligase [Enterobacteriaceae endosymbiont of Donacia tomentosa]|uniref:glutamate--tRNA ligase n=1 Tax=Enterobacteriaceae endosymbiont of Donacia tomentosa TaxID=2675787 RepID=UPI001449A03E|nr:glutamate--tRNA ligase [Enterobacteriaceae endosymbiont of Donacia tomentosa]QJC31478.1 glutamate--tRNA ligase [Enterobacteriaceae endosymbiont of Donacia tomentosa]